MDVAASYGGNFLVEIRDGADVRPFVANDIDGHRQTAARTAVGKPDQLDEQKAENVKLIFDLYLSGQSVIGIIKELEKRRILCLQEKKNGVKEQLM